MRTQEQQRAYQLAWVQKRRQAWLDEQGGSCIDCGSDEALEIDHADSTTKMMPIAQVWSLSPSNTKRIAELAKCVIRCHACHVKKTLVENEHPSGARHWKAKLTANQASDIRNSKEPTKVLAVRYGMHVSSINKVRRGASYRPV